MNDVQVFLCKRFKYHRLILNKHTININGRTFVHRLTLREHCQNVSCSENFVWVYWPTKVGYCLLPYLYHGIYKPLQGTMAYHVYNMIKPQFLIMFVICLVYAFCSKISMCFLGCSDDVLSNYNDGNRTLTRKIASFIMQTYRNSV